MNMRTILRSIARHRMRNWGRLNKPYRDAEGKSTSKFAQNWRKVLHKEKEKEKNRK